MLSGKIALGFCVHNKKFLLQRFHSVCVYNQNRQIKTGDRKYSEAVRLLVSWRGVSITVSKLTVVRITVNKGDFWGCFIRILTMGGADIVGQ